MKRNCIFTNKPANSKFTIGSDKQNWAKSVPCTKEYLADRGDKPPTELEIRLIELFYEQELCRLRIEQYSTQMDEIRSIMSNKLPKKERRKISEIYKEVQAINEQEPNWEDIGPVELTEEDKEWLNAPMGPTEDDKFLGLKEQVEKEQEECPNPKCPSMLIHAPGIGPFCPNKECEVSDNPNGFLEKLRAEELTPEPEPAKVEKKVVKKKLNNLWD